MAKLMESNRSAILGDLGSPTSSRAVNIPKLVNELRDSMQGAYSDWEKIVVTELNKAHTVGSIKSILDDNKGKNPKDILILLS